MYLMILVVIANPRPLESISALIRRVSYLLVLVSVVLIKYYTHLGVTYNVWSGAPEYVGGTTSKNMLGAVCVISGLFFFWDTLNRWPERRMSNVKYTLFVNIAFIAATLWLLQLSHSATSTACLAIGCVVVVLMRGNWVRTSPRLASTVIPVALALSVVLELLFDFSVHIAAFLGRDPTLTGRTGIWEALLSVEINPVIGVGYQSFWLGDRLVTVWRALNTMNLNEAHNGYLETYLNLGIIGLAIMGVILISSYRRIVRTLPTSPHLASWGLALWSVLIVYNVSEAALGPSFLWFVFLLCVVAAHAAPLKTSEAYTPALTQRRRSAAYRASRVLAPYGSHPVGTPEVRVSAGIRRTRIPGDARATASRPGYRTMRDPAQKT
jgi:O-antigen ligase